MSGLMPGRARRWRRVLLPALPLVTIFAVMAVTGSTAAAFTDSGVSPASTFSAGTIALANNDTGSTLLSFTGLQPGVTGSKCFTVTSTGTAPSSVKMYISSLSSTNSLSSYMTMSIVQGTGTSRSCSDFTPLSSGSVLSSGTVPSLSSFSNYATGLGTWTPTGSGTETRTFQISWAVAALAPATTQNSAVTLGLTWEARTA